MSGIAAKGFVEGLQGGIAARDKMDLNREYKSMLQQKNAIGERELAGQEKARMAEWGQAHGGDMSGYEPMQFQKRKDPALMRFGGWLKGKIGGMFGGSDSEEQGAISEASFVSPEIQPAGPQASGAQTFGIPGYADGGRVDPYDDDDVMGIPGAYRRLAEKTHASHEGLAETFDDTRAVWGQADEAMKHHAENITGPGRSPAERGDATRQWLGEGVKGTLGTAAAIGKDVLIDNPVTQAVGGFFGFDGGEDKAAAAQAIPPVEGPGKATAQGDKQAAVSASVSAPEKSDEQMAQEAISEGEEKAAENFDYRMLPQDTRPEDLPSMNTQDWTDYRAEMVDALMLQGKDPSEAHKIVDDITVDQQMRGMNRELAKAMSYLQMGDFRSASFAIRQGFQYFPNGVDVKFAVQKGKDGREVLVALGTDEQTGEVTGKPMMITPEILGVMRENFSNPAAFRTWTKDGRDMQLQLREQGRKEFDSRSNASYREESAITDRMNAGANQIRALTGGSSAGGAKQTDIRAGIKVAKEYLFNHGVELEPEEAQLAEELVGIMRTMQPDLQALPDERIAALILQAASEGQLNALYEDLLSRQGG